MPHILVDFDRTLAQYESWEKNGTDIGPPIPLMVNRVKGWLDQGLDVRIFTARASCKGERLTSEVKLIQDWCETHIGRRLPVQNYKDFDTVEIWDDLAVAVIPNTGIVVY
jgi:hypothetical protein